ncbi:MAG: 2-amino-4-hydroxy-6-hydroxymethyldihydropteridine diphosphokinase [Demequinaceae bacterium]|nr:2-amino-4-hydroxy-6-hydroxymethyldihydropteridine diphosphokinase [Demequinaceae bacterium]
MGVNYSPYLWHGIQLDTVVIEGIQAMARHGVLPKEKETPQTFLVDVVVHLDTRAAARSDEIAKTIDYGVAAKEVVARLTGEPVDLIETVAERIARGVLELGAALAIDVIVHKPGIDLGVPFGDVCVQIRRELKGGDIWSDMRIGSSAGLADDPRSPGAVPPPKDILDERPAAPVPVILAIGGNIGDVEYTLARAVEDLGRVESIGIVAVSPLVATKPVGGPPQPDFLNAVVKIETVLSSRALLHICQGIEMIHGRERSVQDGPRTLDIDLITYGELVASAIDLVLPHPSAFQRAFVLAPWAAIEPEAVLPASEGSTGGKVADLAAAAPDASSLTVVQTPWDPAAVLAARAAQPGIPNPEA